MNKSIKRSNDRQNLESISSMKLSHYTASRLKKLVVGLANEIPAMPLDVQIIEARRVASELRNLDQNFSTMMKCLNDNLVSALYIEGLPAFDGELAPMLNRTLSLVLSNSLGECFQYQQQHGGQVIPVLVPKEDSLENTNSSWAEEFKGHTDDAFIPRPYRVRYIALLGERNDSKASTGYAPIDDIIEQLTEDELEVLQRYWYRFRLPVSFEGEALGEEWSPEQPIIVQDVEGNYVVQSPTYGTAFADYANHTKATEAFESFKNAVDRAMQWFVVERSTYLVFNNDYGLHARGQISTGAGSRRVYRTYIHNDLDIMRRVTGTNGNVFNLAQLLTYFKRNQTTHYS